MEPTCVGTSVLRREGRDKLLGAALYTADLKVPGLLHGITVRSRVPRGRVKAIRFGEGIPWDEITVVTARDLPGPNVVVHIGKDQPCLASEWINHPEEAIVLLAHWDPYLLERARAAVTVEVEELDPVLSLEDSLARRQVIWGEDNCFKAIRIEKGCVDPVWAEAAHVLEGEYATGAQEQLYIEPHIVVAEATEDSVFVRGSMQCPYYVHHALVELFGLPEDRVRVVQMATGGGFGGKEDYPSMIACHAALLARKAGRPVRIAYDREEDMACTTKRHPSRTRIRSAFDIEGRLQALDIHFLLDGGAYMTITPVVLSRGAIHAAGPYACPNVRIQARALATNHPPHGAFRGFGAPQSLFALERHMDEAAVALGLDPAELRRRNFLRKGDTLATGQVVKEDLDLPGLLQQALREIHYEDAKAACALQNASGGPMRRGVGLAVFMHGCGFTGSGEVTLASRAGLEALPDGSVRVLAASTEIGQGATTVFTQIAADALKIPMALVTVAERDTDRVPNSGPTVASRTTMVVGKLVQDAALALRHTLLTSGLLKEPYGPDAFREAVARHLTERGPLEAIAQYQRPPDLQWDDAAYRGDAYATYAWACYAAAVQVDLVTYEATVEDFVAVQEVGRVINPVMAAGQIEGGVAQGIGWALSEDVRWHRGRMANASMTNYIMPTAMDLPPIRVFFQENPHPAGPGGAKGIGELPMDGTAPAVLNAVAHALDVQPRQVPLTPERLMELVEVPRD